MGNSQRKRKVAKRKQLQAKRTLTVFALSTLALLVLLFLIFQNS
jgi:type VI protein secretion system component VasF